MISRWSVSGKMEKLREYAKYLKVYRTYPPEKIKKDHTLQGALLHYLQLSIKCTIDMGEIIISEGKFRKPQEAREVFSILAAHKILPADFAERFSNVTGFRNILVHEYAEVDLDKVYEYLQQDLKDFDFYAQCIAKFLNKKN